MKKLLLTSLLVVAGLLLNAHTADAAIGRAPNNLGLIGYWSFNEGTSTIAHDFSGNKKHATFPGGSNNPAWSSGKLREALNFDGGDYVMAGLDANQYTSVTVSLWVNPAIVSASQKGIFQWASGLTDGTPFILITYDTGNVEFFVDSGYRLTTALSPNVWSHLSATYNSSTDVWTFYINGIQSGSTYSDTSPTNQSDSSDVYFGNGYNGYYNGKIDEVRVYSRALSATEVAALYNSGAARMGTRTDVLTDGLVGHWTMDGKDTNWGTNKIGDISGQTNHGTLTNMSTTTSPVPGKVGQGMKLDGSNDYVSLGTSASLAFSGVSAITACSWVKINAAPSASSGYAIIGKWHASGATNSRTYALVIGGNSVSYKGISFFIQKSGATTGFSNANVNPSTYVGAWHHFCGTWDGSTITVYDNGIQVGTPASFSGVADTSTREVRIGNHSDGSAEYLNGSVDDVRMYNRVLTAAEIKQLYNTGAGAKQGISSTDDLTSGLVGYWTFDGKHTNWATHKTNDQSGGGFHATLKNMGTTTGTSFGKIGQAVVLDGVNDYVDVGTVSVDLESDFTVSTWMKSPAPTGSEKVAVGIGHSSISTRLTIGFYTDGKPRILFRQDGNSNIINLFNSGSNIADNKFHHVVFAFKPSSSTYSLYIDGVAVVSNGSYTSFSSISANYLTFGALNLGGITSISNVAVDDTRLYNRALSAGEVKQLYNMGL